MTELSPVWVALLVRLLSAPAEVESPAATDDLARFVDATPRCPEKVKHCFGIALHVVRTESDALVRDERWISERLTN